MNLESVLARFADVEESADGWLVRCPSHADSKPSLRLAIGDRAFLVKCRAGCKTDDVLKAAGLTTYDLPDVSTLKGRPRVTSTSAPASPAAVAALAVRLDAWAGALNVADGGARDAISYAERRFGLALADSLRLGLGYATDLGGGPRLVVPFRDEHGVARGFQARALTDHAAVRWLGPSNPDGASWAKVAYFPGASGWDELVVTEGPSDGLTSCGVGFDTVSIRGAALAANEDVVSEVARIAGDRPVVVFGDRDEAGDRFSRTLVGALAARGVHAVSARPEALDVTAWREMGPARFHDAFPTAVKRAAGAAPSRVAARLDAHKPADLTDLGMARRLHDRIVARGSDVRFTPEAGFYLLEGGVWRIDGLDNVRTTAQDSAAALWREADEIEAEVLALDPDSSEGKRHLRRLGQLRAFARHANSTRGIDSMVRELRALPGVAVDVTDFDARHNLLAVRNGVIDLRTGSLLDHDPAFLLTRRIDVDYVPDARAPRWERFLEEVFPTEPRLPSFMQRLVGYGITGETTEQCFAVLWGTGANGKSVFTDTLSDVFAEVKVTTPFSTFEQRPNGGIPNDLAALKGARLVFAAEGEQGRPMAESVLKRVTGRDLISARFMRREFFEFRPTFLLMLATNFRPQFRGQDEGLWRRVKLIPWERYFAPAERDHGLGDRLLDERAGIVAWAVRGAVEWYARGLQDPPVVVEATKEYRETSDALAGFIGDGGDYIVTHDETHAVPGRALWDAYRQWADDENLPDREQWTRRTFFAALEERGVEKRKRNNGVTFIGVRKSRASDRDEEEPQLRADEPAPTNSSPVPTIPTTGPSLSDVL